MPILGYKKNFKNIKTLSNDLFIINFNLKYTKSGSLSIKDKNIKYFDVGDFHYLIDKVFDDFDEKTLKEYDNGIYILSICKYLIDKIPGIYSIVYETNNMIDTYYKDEILKDYFKINKKHKSNIRRHYGKST